MNINVLEKRRRIRKKPVTLIVGIICRDGIVVASDSQTTDEWSMARTDATKIYKIDLNDKTSGLVATAGSVDFGLQLVEGIEELAKSKALNGRRAIADLAEQSNGQIKQKERSQFRRSSKELQRHFEDHRSILLIANYYKRTPCIFTLKSDGLVSPTILKNQLFTSIGNSYAIANYLLKKFDFEKMDMIEGVLASVYVVNEVINSKDSTCDHPIQVGTVSCSMGTLRNESSARLWKSDWLDYATKEIAAQEADTREEQKARLSAFLIGAGRRVRDAGGDRSLRLAYSDPADETAG